MMDLSGHTYGRLTVICEAEAHGRSRLWLCRCACGVEKVVRQNHLRGGTSRSCGCLNQQCLSARGHDLVGKKFGFLTVKNPAPNRGVRRCWECECKCGRVTVVSTAALIRGQSRSCGVPRAHFPSMDGAKFTRWTVVREAPMKSHNRRVLCRCECGVTKIVMVSSLNSGHSRSCGCLARDTPTRGNLRHGMVNTPEWITWCSMRQRCENTSTPAYANYGGRGITVCKRWTQFENFFADMGLRPKGHSLDRIRNSGNYSPRNCRWATPRQQMRNTRINKIVIYRGQEHCLATWCEKLGLAYGQTYSRLNRGWSVTRAFTEKVR